MLLLKKFNFRALRPIRLASYNSQTAYEILGLEPNCTEIEIKKSFNKLVKKYHPDKNPNGADMFTKIRKAYDLLNDPEKRAEYDMKVSRGAHDQFFMNSQSTSDKDQNFDFFYHKKAKDEFVDEMYVDIKGYFGKEHTMNKVKGKDISLDVEIDFLEAVHGSQFIIKLDKLTRCSTCNGSKCEEGTAPSRCWSCGGKGYIMFREGAVMAKARCDKCKGGGMTIKYPCKPCQGEGVETQTFDEFIRIPKGTREGEEITVKGKGHQSFNGDSGDLLICVKVVNDSLFDRNGDNISSTQFLKLWEAVLGNSVELLTLYGKYKLPLEGGINNGDYLILENFGVNKKVYHKGHDASRAETKGNHFLYLKVQTPTKLSEEEILLFERLREIERGYSQSDFAELGERETVGYSLDLTETREYGEQLDELKSLEKEENFIAKLRKRWYGQNPQQK